ncbi:MAG TPA: RNA polymerase subunit sigma-24 [Anaerolineae bacterium]|jgi:RNA polymerase sigma-70 factor (ECF subfamily)|nr:RNA polymerase subunit sigma-24 [Anaerolineae bacterium]
MEDQTAITRIKQGDLDGLESLVERYQARAVQAAYLVVFDRALAEDVAQAAFIKAAERIRQFDETRPFAPWFLRIVTNDALKAARQGQRNLSLDDGPASRFDESLSAPGLLPEQLLEQAETRRDLLAAVHSLSPEQRAVITLHYFLDLSEADMSARLERPTSTIKWWLREARKHLRNLLDGSR